MFWAADIRGAAYDPETISMITTVLERAVAALPRQDQTEERKRRLASSILGAAARESVTTLLLYATALEAALGSPPSGRALPPSHEVYPLSNIPDRVAALTWRGLDDAIPRWVCANAVLRLFLCGRNRYQEPGVVRLE